MRLLLLSLILVTAMACDRKPSSAVARAKWSPAGKLWAETMAGLLPKMMCSSAGYFVSCFPKSAGDCMAIAAAQVNDCLDRNADWVPQDVNRQSGEEAGTKLGGCTGRQLEIELRKRGSFTDTPRCHDVAYWSQVMKDQALEQTKKL